MRFYSEEDGRLLETAVADKIRQLKGDYENARMMQSDDLDLLRDQLGRYLILQDQLKRG